MKLRTIFIAIIAVIAMSSAVAGAHVPTIKTTNTAHTSDYLAPESVYSSIFNSNMGGECGASLTWLCGESKDAKPYEGLDGLSRVGSHSRYFKVKFGEIRPGWGRKRVCVQRWYHKTFAVTNICYEGTEYWYGIVPGAPA